MSFLAKLFLDNTVRKVLNANVLVKQGMDMYQCPNSNVRGGYITIKVESSLNDFILWEWAVSPTMMKNGYIRFYNRDGMSRFADLEFWDCYCIDYFETYKDVASCPMQLRLVLSPGILRFKDKVFSKNWRLTDLSMQDVEATTLPVSNGSDPTENEDAEGPEPKLEDIYYTDSEGKKLTDLPLGIIYLVLKSSNAIGETVEIDLSEDYIEFKYNNSVVENDIIQDFSITQDMHQIEIEVIAQKL